MTNPSEVVADLRIAAEDARRFSAALFDRGYVRREGVRPFSELLERAADTIDRLTSSGEAVAEDDEAYELGKRDGYEQAVQDIDVLTGGDGEYRYCTDHDPDRHTPDAATMKQRIADRFAAVSPREGHVEVPVEHGWVLERADSSPAEPWYWAAGQIDPTRSSAWTQNHMAGIRFARREDAEAVSYRLMRKAKIDVRVCAHEWSAALPHNQGETKPETWDLAARAENGETNL